MYGYGTSRSRIRLLVNRFLFCSSRRVSIPALFSAARDEHAPRLHAGVHSCPDRRAVVRQARLAPHGLAPDTGKLACSRPGVLADYLLAFRLYLAARGGRKTPR